MNFLLQLKEEKKSRQKKRRKASNNLTKSLINVLFYIGVITYLGYSFSFLTTVYVIVLVIEAVIDVLS